MENLRRYAVVFRMDAEGRSFKVEGGKHILVQVRLGESDETIEYDDSTCTITFVPPFDEADEIDLLPFRRAEHVGRYVPCGIKIPKGYLPVPRCLPLGATTD